MGFLIGQIIAFLAGAALIGLFIGWALFGGKKAPAASGGEAAPAPPPPPPGPGPDTEALKKAEARAKELAAEREGLSANLSERDDEIAQLRHQIAQAEQYRVESANRVEQFQAQIGSLQDQLRARDADLALSGSGGDDLAAAELSAKLREREAELKRLQLAYDELKEVAGPDAPAITELKAQVAELRAVLESGDDLAPAAGDDEQVKRLLEQNAKLTEENLGLKAAYDAAERSLEEQDGAMDQLSHVLLKSQQESSTLKQEVGELRDKLGLPPLPEPPTSRTIPRPVTGPPATAPLATPPVGTPPVGTPPVGPPPPPPPAPRPTAPASQPAAPPSTPTPAVAAADEDDAADEATMAIPAFELPDEGPPTPPPAPPAPETKADAPAPPKALEGPPKVAALEGPPKVAALEGPVAAKALAAPAPAAEPQDLKAIKGIGPATEKRLVAAGVVSWAQIAALEGDALEALAEEIKVSSDKIRKDAWVEQARELQAGG